MTHIARTSRRHTGVTLMEMMVALAITTFVILIVNQLFNEVIATVGRGTQAGEILQRSRAFDEQLATETEMQLSGGKDPSNSGDWWGRMVGPRGRTASEPGGFLAVVQRQINAPLTLDEAIEGVNHVRPIRSDQLMFIYDQKPQFDQTGKKRLPPLAPAGNYTFAGDMRNSLNADYVRIWYGHAAQLNSAGAFRGDLGDDTNPDNPNFIAQDWVLGRHALFLTDSSGNPGTRPFGAYISGTPSNYALNTDNVIDGPGGQMYEGNSDVIDATLDYLVNTGADSLSARPNATSYQGRILTMMFAGSNPLHTSAKPVTDTAGNLSAWDTAPSHTYFMGGVSDFIVEFAGDLVTGENYANNTYDPDGELDRDPDGRIKWYSAFDNNPDLPGFDENYPVSYQPPQPTSYRAAANNTVLSFYPRADAAFIWQHYGSPGFTTWPWMLRIRYRLHDRRGEFDGRVLIDAAGKENPEPGAWFETIIPVNHQGIVPVSPPIR